jgi:predicted  nucleic acid-binding Zn-ribbon protein
VSASKASLDADYSASQQQLEAKAAELEGLQEEAARHQQQLQNVQTQLEDQCPPFEFASGARRSGSCFFG